MEDAGDDACIVVEPPVVEVETQNSKKQKKLRKGKSEGSKAIISTTERGDEDVVLNYTLLRSIPPTVDIAQEVTDAEQSKFTIIIYLGSIIPMYEIMITLDMSEHPAVPSAADSMGKTAIPSNMFANVGDVGSGFDNSEGGSVNASSMDGLKDNAPTRGNEGRPTIIDTSNDVENVETVTLSVMDTTIKDVEGMTSIDIPSADGTDVVTIGIEDVTPSVNDNGAGAVGLSEETTEPTVGKCDADILNAEDLEIPENADQEKKKSKKIKYKKGGDEGEASKPKKKLSKKESAAKRARKTERNAIKVVGKVAEEQVGDEDVQKAAGEQVPVDVRPTDFDSGNPAIEQQEAGNNEADLGSDAEDIAVVIIRRRKAKGKLKINENRIRVGNKRIPKNVAAVSTENVAVNSEEEEAKWRFVAIKKIVAEKMLSEVTKKNADIMRILEGTGPPSTLANSYLIRLQHAQSHAVLKLTAYPSLPCNIIESKYSNIPTTIDDEGPSPGLLTISLKLLQGASNDETTRFLRDEIRHLEGVIQSSLARKSVLEARLRSLTGEDDLVADPAASNSEVETSQE
ncbi:hypothetical protein LIER_25022 [Lithospermum erythrorhizon]|uniref:Uncharacterized protein n=1 Tax=Lithospermum erythrorhizon TaxID=34254 RepID=A0AAV3R6E9_LITER